MKALALTDQLTAETMEITDRDLPEPGEGQVRLRVRARGLNPVDYKAAPGQAPGEILGVGVTGTVDALGAGVTGVDEDHRVRV